MWCNVERNVWQWNKELKPTLNDNQVKVHEIFVFNFHEQVHYRNGDWVVFVSVIFHHNSHYVKCKYDASTEQCSVSNAKPNVNTLKNNMCGMWNWFHGRLISWIVSGWLKTLRGIRGIPDQLVYVLCGISCSAGVQTKCAHVEEISLCDGLTPNIQSQCQTNSFEKI